MMTELLTRRILWVFVAIAFTPSVGWSQLYVDNRASTPAQAQAQGLADVTRSAGAANLMNSAAAQNYTQAESQRLDNNLKATETYFQKRQINESYQKSQERPRLSDEALFRVNKERTPDKLSASQLDAVTGQIDWPLVLQDSAFAEYRTKLEADFAERAEKGGHIGPDAFLDIRNTTEAMTNELKKLVRKYPGTEYSQARNFIKSLSYESNFPTG